ncbi:hypothetical protein ZYGR_0AF02490 [Zygosaccharomyces rouxii]|uniref:Nuclear rim protein 1 n=1 Tax=Zygosaccharomyces rouxii TaxID=4956 RepID=A0A1Q3A7Z1_ZYGRO|nr:hypothetical protein ZYGR_0AF02490 [Zygosaccharomyces rouxii]
MSLRISKDVSVSVNTADSLPEDDGFDGAEGDNRSWFSVILGLFNTHPSDWHIALNEAIETIDWDSKSVTLAQPLGNFFTFVFYVVRLLQINLIKPNLHRINEKTDHFDLLKSEMLKKYEYLYQFTQDQNQSVGNVYDRFLGRLGKLFDICIVLLIFTNGFIAYKFFFGDFKMYCLFYLRKGSHLKNVTKGSLQKLGQDDDDGSLWSSLRRFWNGEKGREENNNDKEDDDDDVYYKLFKWTPSQFITIFFVSFAPTAVAFLLFTEVSFLTVIAVIFHQWILHRLVVDCYGNRLVHESAIASANLAEVEAKFIKPRMSKKVQDVAIDCTPHGDGVTKFHPALTVNRSHIFQTHSLTGDLITETFNPLTKEFEDLKMQEATHNVVGAMPHIAEDLFHKDPYWHQRNTFMRDAVHRPYFNSREVSPTRFHPSRISPRPGQYSPLVSSTSGMSTPLMRPDRSPYLNTRPSLGEREELFRRGNSRSPVRQPVESVKSMERSFNSQSPIKKYNGDSDA